MKYLYKLILRNGNKITVMSDLEYEDFIDHTLGSAAKFGGFVACELIENDNGSNGTIEYKTAIRLSDIIQATPLLGMAPSKDDK